MLFNLYRNKILKTDYIYTVSIRGKKCKYPIQSFLKEEFPSLPIDKIDSVFGFVEASALYSGRPYLGRQISDNDYQFLQKNNIGLRIPFTNHYCTRKEFDENRPIFEKYHKKGNSVITTNEDLAKWIRSNYPNYQLEASILKNISTQKEINRCLDIYDTVVLPMNLNLKTDFLESIENKDKITLFGNAGCALSCPNRICYEYLSKHNKKLTQLNKPLRYLYFVYHIGLVDKWCMHRIKPRNLKGLTDFNLNTFKEMGFKRFKMLREHKERNSGY